MGWRSGLFCSNQAPKHSTSLRNRLQVELSFGRSSRSRPVARSPNVRSSYLSATSRRISFDVREIPFAALVGFRLALKPSAVEIGRICATGKRVEAIFLFSFGEATASHRVDDVWTACCEMYLQAQLAEQSDLQSFRLAGEELFTLRHEGDVVVCSWSRHHIFAVQKREFVRSLESLIDQVLASVPGRTP